MHLKSKGIFWILCPNSWVDTNRRTIDPDYLEILSKSKNWNCQNRFVADIEQKSGTNAVSQSKIL